MRVKGSLLGVVVLVCLCGGRAEAGPAEDRAAADALFQEGRELLKGGRAAEACPKLAASQKLDPRPGRLLALGDCYETNGETASAWATFREAESTARAAKDERRMVEAARRAGELELKLAKLVVEVAPEARVAGLEVRRNGKRVEEAVWGAAVPVDPGEQRIEAAAPGKKGWAEKIVVEGKAGVTTVRVPALGDEVVVERVGAMKEEGAGKNGVAIGVVAALGAVGIGTGIGLLVAASSLVSDADAQDDAMPDGACSPLHPRNAEFSGACGELRGKLERSQTLHNVGLGAAIAGGVIGVGTLIYALMPSKKPATMGFQVLPTVAPTYAGISAIGQF
ncbi:hypothetical protein [Polyangium mundeleinium]|uniref:Tetratricopeptide repeat protein n=1 Tax=Polyangium mundeleinium TaxID=2995306 RepID=A0ABT5EKF8_9BACT|nr:hypothetical protein [Polyangium mundeleinium]MDC0742320.1 hypothetical protein [Polyangium mundeleinium]